MLSQAMFKYEVSEAIPAQSRLFRPQDSAEGPFRYRGACVLYYGSPGTLLQEQPVSGPPDNCPAVSLEKPDELSPGDGPQSCS